MGTRADCASHHNTAPSAPERSACSAAQAASAALSGVTTVSRSSAMPSAASAGAYGTKGAARRGQQQLGQPGRGPAAAGQLDIERGMAGGALQGCAIAIRCRAIQLISPPD
jgi:hypothetical protein